MRRSAGRTSSSKLTMADTGLPGRPKTGVPILLERPEGERLGRPDRHLHPPHRPRAPLLEDHLDDVEIPHAHPAAGDQRVAPVGGAVEGEAERRFVIADHPEVDADPNPRGRRGRGAHGDWRRGSGPVPAGPGPVTSSSPVDSTPIRGRGWTDTSATPRLANTPMMAGRHHRARLGHHVADGHVLAGPADGLAPADRMVDGHDRTAVLDPTSPRACTRRRHRPAAGAPVMIRAASPGPIVPSSTDPAMIDPTTRRRTGPVPPAGTGGVGRPERVAVPGRVDEGWDGLGGHDRCPDDASQCLVDRQRDRGAGDRTLRGPEPGPRPTGSRAHFLDVVAARAPVRAARPCLALPDRDRALECVDAVLGGGKGLGPVGRRRHDGDGGLPDIGGARPGGAAPAVRPSATGCGPPRPPGGDGGRPARGRPRTRGRSRPAGRRSGPARSR